MADVVVFEDRPLSQQGVLPRRVFCYQADHPSHDLDQPTASAQLDQESQRALALFYALNMANDAAGLNHLLEFAGQPPDFHNGSVIITPTACVELAHALRRAGYGLDDESIKRFKMERGFPATAGITTAVASAYARLARGNDAKLNITDADWHSLGDEGRRALQILLLIGRKPEDLRAIRHALGIRNAPQARPGPLLIGQVSARQLVQWAHQHGLDFTPGGLAAIGHAMGQEGAELKGVATFITDAVLSRSEPRHDYARLSYQGHVLNRRTIMMFNKAAALLQPDLEVKVIRGSYQSYGARGAHPHLGGGVLDIGLKDAADCTVERAITALRCCGFAAWYRQREGKGEPHIHAVAIGDREMSPAAAWQVREYLLGRDGRSHSAPDPHAHICTTPPVWVAKYRLALTAPQPTASVTAAPAENP